MGWNIVMSTISVWKNGLYKVSLKWIWQFFIFIFRQQAKTKRGKEERKHSILGTFFFTSMISKRKGKALISLTVHDSRSEGGLSPFGKSWTARVFILLMAFGNDFTAQIVMRLLQCKWDTSEIFYLKTPTTDHWYHWKFSYLIDFGSLSMLITTQTTYYLVAFILY